MTLTCWCHSALHISFSADSELLIQEFSPLWSWEVMWWLQKIFKNKPTQKGCGMGWRRHICGNVSFGSICLRSLCSLAQGSSLLLLWKLMSYSREQMHCTDLCSQALHAAHMPGKGASTLQQLSYAGKPSLASTECGRMVKAIVIILKGILYISIRGLICPDFRQDPGKICQ